MQEPAKEFFCPVSFELLVSAKQTSCCGQHLTEEVAFNLEENNKPCPMCNTPNLNTHKDLHYRRQVAQIQIFCTNKSSGCAWQGTVQDLDKHLNYGQVGSEENCRYVDAFCPYLCRMHIVRNKLQRHMQEDCDKRPYKCNYCNEEGTHGFIIKSHLPVCPKFPTKCPKDCDNLMRREELQTHLATQCPNMEVACEFAYAGCSDKGIRRKNLKKHMDESGQAHVILLAAHGRKKDGEIEALKAQVQLLTNTLTRRFQSPQDLIGPGTPAIGFVPPPPMVFRQFREFASKKKKWRSPSFYSHIGGYKMSLLVLPNSQTDATGNQQMGVYLQLLRGEFDDQLQWPFHGKVIVRLVNQVGGDNGHIDHNLLDASSYRSSKFNKSMVDRVTGAEATSCWGCVNFVSMKTLEEKSSENIRYLREDSLIFHVLEVSLLSAEETCIK